VLGNAQTAGTEMMRIARLNQMEVEVDVNENDIVNVSIDDEVDIEVDAYPNRIFEGRVTEIANSADVSGGGSAEQITNYKVKIRISTPHNLDSGPEDYIVQVNDPEMPNRAESPNFKPGMSGTVDIRTNTVVDVVSVPIQAVTVRDFSEIDEEANSEAEADSTVDSSDTESTSTGAQRTTRSSQEEDFRKVVFLNDNGVAKRVEVETGISDNTHIQILSGVREGDEIVTGNYRVLSRELEDGDKITVTGGSTEQQS
jgi:HlyD family secretion protein